MDKKEIMPNDVEEKNKKEKSDSKIIDNSYDLTEAFKKMMEGYTIKTNDKKDNELDTLYKQYDEAETNEDKIRIGNKILELNPDDLDIKSDIILAGSEKDTLAIKELKELAEENKEKFFEDNNIDDLVLKSDIKLNLYESVSNRPYLRLLFKIGTYYFYSFNSIKAEEYLSLVLRLDDNDNLGTRGRLACIYMASGNKEKLTAITNRYKEDPEIEIVLGLGDLIESGNKDKLLEAFEKYNLYAGLWLTGLLGYDKKEREEFHSFEYFRYRSPEEGYSIYEDIFTTITEDQYTRFVDLTTGGFFYDFLKIFSKHDAEDLFYHLLVRFVTEQKEKVSLGELKDIAFGKKKEEFQYNEEVILEGKFIDKSESDFDKAINFLMVNHIVEKEKDDIKEGDGFYYFVKALSNLYDTHKEK